MPNPLLDPLCFSITLILGAVSLVLAAFDGDDDDKNRPCGA